MLNIVRNLDKCLRLIILTLNYKDISYDVDDIAINSVHKQMANMKPPTEYIGIFAIDQAEPSGNYIVLLAVGSLILT